MQGVWSEILVIQESVVYPSTFLVASAEACLLGWRGHDLIEIRNENISIISEE